MSDKLLVTGASGKLGRLVIGHLLETYSVPASQIIAGSRDVTKIADLADQGVETRTIDFDDAASMDKGFAGIDRLLIISTDALDAEGTRKRQHLAAIEAARKSGVGHIFYTSMPSADDNRVTFGPDHAASEAAIKASGRPYTIFRNGWYMENLFMALPQALQTGQWYTAAGEGRLAHISRDDIARAIASELANPTVENVTYTLTGTTARTTAEIAALAKEVTGKPLEVVNLTDEQLASGMAAAGVPEPFIPTLVSFDINTREGKISMITGDAEKLSGSTPVDLKEFLESNRSALAA